MTRSLIKRTFGLAQICKKGEKRTSFVVKKIHNIHNDSSGIISTCLFGNMTGKWFRKLYLEPLLYNAGKIHEILPGWYVRVYVAPNISPELLEKLLDNDCEVFIMKEMSTNFVGTLWRFLPAAETKPFITFDADMKLDTTGLYIAKLPKNIKKWLKSDKIFFQRTLGHINIFVPISAGMWGAKPKKDNTPSIPDITQKMEKYCNNWFGCDEAFLTKEVYPEFKKYGCYKARNLTEYIVYCIILIIIIIFIIKIIRR